MNWKIIRKANIKINSPVLIEGLPGIGNVGKIAADFMVEELLARKIIEIKSHHLPHSVFVNEENLVELPKIEIYHKKIKSHDLLFLCGDVQPADEASCYEFSEKIIELCTEIGCKDILTLGGIGLMEIPKEPKLFITGNTRKAVTKYKDKSIQHKLYGVVGPIIGVTGLLVGMAPRKVDAVALLAETYGHPMYLGVKGAKEIVRFLTSAYKFKLKLDKLDKEIKTMEEETAKGLEALNKLTQQGAFQKIKGKQEVNYIG